MSDTKSRISPIVAIAAGSVIVFSAVGVGVMTGLMPSSFSNTAQAPAVAQAPLAPPVADTAPQPPAVQEPVARPRRAAEAPRQAREPARVAANRPCATCGRVSAVRVVEHEGEGTGLGAVAGGGVGGVLGNQVGRGSGRTVATVAGAAGGAYAGHQIEKHVKKSSSWSVIVRMDDGSSRSFAYASEPGFRAGDAVKVVNGKLAAR